MTAGEKLLDNKHALITGSSRGIGKAIAYAYAAEGAHIAICYKSQQGLAEEVATDLHDRFAVNTIPVRLDVNSRTSTQGAVRQVLAKFGSIDILINNAGINITNDYDKISDDDWHQVIEPKGYGIFMVTQEVFRVMREQKSGAVINIDSLSGRDGGPRTPSYAFVNAGLQGLTLNQAREGSKFGVRVNSISPGVIASDLTEQTMHPDIKKARLQEILLGRFGKYDEVAQAAVFLGAEKMSSYITGIILPVAGGAHLTLY